MNKKFWLLGLSLMMLAAFALTGCLVRNDALVVAQVEGADGDRSPLHSLDGFAVSLELFFFAGHVAAPQENELGAEQADAVGA